MTNLAPIGHNNPPDPIDEAVAPFADAIAEAENWLDGTAVETEEQMKAVDAIIKEIRTAGTSIDAARKEATAPLRKAWQAENARWNVTIDDIERIKTGLVAAVAGIKQKLADEKEAAKKAAFEKARRLEDEAKRAAMDANVSDIEAQREAAEKLEAAKEAAEQAQVVKSDKVKWTRKVHKHEVFDLRALVNWIAKNDKDAMAEFAREYALKNHKATKMDGVNSWTEKEAY